MKKLVLLLALFSLTCQKATPPSVAAVSTDSTVAMPASGSPILRRVPRPDHRIALRPRLTVDPAFAHFAGQSSFVYQPGGVPGGIVYTTWPDVAQAIKLSPGRRNLLVDDRLAPAHMTAGGPYDLDNTTLMGQEDSATFTLHIDTGATFTSSSLAIINGLLVSCEAAASPWTPSGFSALYVKDSSLLVSTAGAAPFLHIQAAASASFIFLFDFSAVGDGTHNAVTVDVGQSVGVIAADTCSLNPHAVGGAGTVSVNQSAGAQIDAQDAITSIFLSTLAANTSYTPTVPGNWNPVPTAVGPALNQLAAANFVQVSAGTGSGTGTISATTANLAKKKSGNVSVACTATGTTSGAATVTAQLLRDATPIGSAVPFTVAAAASFALPANFVDTLPDTANHTYTCQATASAGTIGTTASGVAVRAIEIN